MRRQPTTREVAEPAPNTGRGPRLAAELREQALQSALRKRAAGVPTYSVPEAAALLSISPEYLYRLIRAERFPAVRMGLAAEQGKYIVAAKVVEQLLDETVSGRGSIDVSDWPARTPAIPAGGVA